MVLVQSLARPLKSTGKPAPSFILNVVCTSVAYFSMHAHPYWPTLIQDLANSLAESDDQATCLLSTLTYMANDCDNDSIVIEDSIRQAFFNYLDQSARQLVFKNILDSWAQRLP